MSRVTVYIDGFNLYFGLRSKGWRKYYWLDLVRLSRAMLKTGQQLEAVHYFTSRIVLSGNNSEDIDRQNTYLQALSTFPLVTLHFGLSWTSRSDAAHAEPRGFVTRRK